MGTPARSWLGWQLPIRTEEAHARARIIDIDTGALTAAMAKGEVAVIPGFQGMMDDGRVATLGRGGSDTSAVAVAAAIKADRCDIYTDVDGVYTTDPRIVARARDRKSKRLNSSHSCAARMPSSACKKKQKTQSKDYTISIR